METTGVLITGGAGYVGSQTVLRLAERGYRLVVLDDLSTGRAESVLAGELIHGDAGDMLLVENLLREFHVSVVIHLAAKTVVPESVERPLYYYDQNTSRTRNLLDCCVRAGVDKIVFSSTAAVYGIPDGGIASENSATNPINPYGSSKLMCERMIADVASTGKMRFVTLRYFNVAGCDPDGRTGQSKNGCTLLTKVACEAAVGARPHVTIFGTDYETSDGTGVRDYIHVDDIARAHIDALEYLLAGGESQTLNCGYGHGYSVRAVLESVERIDGKPLEIREAPRRAGDPPVLVADAARIRSVLGWSPRHDNLDDILRSALQWEYRLAGKTEPHPGSVVGRPADTVLHGTTNRMQ